MNQIPLCIPDKKYCNGCKLTKYASEFYRLTRRGKTSLQSKCKTCHSDWQKKYHGDTKADRQAYRRIQTLKEHGLTVEEYDKMLKVQNGACKICKQKELYSTSDTPPVLAIDHDHKTGKVRGLLCSQCNQGLGKFRDNPDLLEAAIAYLESHK